MWINEGKSSFDLKEVSTVTLQEDDGKVVLIMKNGQQLVINDTRDGTLSKTYDSITRLLEVTRKAEDRITNDSFELLKRILSELKLISQNLRRF